MKAAPHPRQAERLAALHGYGILDTPREADFDDIVDLASRLCEAPVSVVNLIDADRQWFKAEVGLGVRETPLDTSLCSHAILLDNFLEVPDTLADPRLCDNPLCLAEGGFRFYAGALLRTAEGLPLGTLCILDTRPRRLTDLQADALKVLAAQVMKQLDLRRALREVANLRREADHRIKNSFQSVAALIRLQARQVAEPDARAVLDMAQARLGTYAALHDLLGRAQAGDRVALDAYLGEVCALLRGTLPPGVVLTALLEPALAAPDRAARIGIILNEWCMNAAKHAFPGRDGGSITVTGKGRDSAYTLRCVDDGAGEGSGQGRPPGVGTAIIGASASALGASARRLDLPRGTGWEIAVPLGQS